MVSLAPSVICCEISWKCHICGTQGLIKYRTSYDPKNRAELDFEVRMGHEKIEIDHQRIRPNCQAKGLHFFDITVEQFPPGFFNQ